MCVKAFIVNLNKCLKPFFLEQHINIVNTVITVSIHCAPEMSEIDCIGRIERFWPKFVRGW